MAKISFLGSVLGQHCPRCRQGKLYSQSNPYNFNRMAEMPEACSHCGQKFQIEPSFYFGAMYASYGLAVAVSVAVIVLLFLFGLGSLENILIAVPLVLLLLTPVLFRLSRSIWIHIFVKYDPKFETKED